MSEQPFHELNQLAQYAEHIRWIADTYSLPKKAEEKLRLTADVLDAESKVFEALEQRVEELERANTLAKSFFSLQRMAQGRKNPRPKE